MSWDPAFTRLSTIWSETKKSHGLSARLIIHLSGWTVQNFDKARLWAHVYTLKDLWDKLTKVNANWYKITILEGESLTSPNFRWCYNIICDRNIHQPLTCRPPNSDKLGDLVTMIRVNIKVLTLNIVRFWRLEETLIGSLVSITVAVVFRPAL